MNLEFYIIILLAGEQNIDGKAEIRAKHMLQSPGIKATKYYIVAHLLE